MPSETILGVTAVKPNARASILVLEDDDAFRRFLVRVLQGAGFAIVETGNGGDALRLVEGNQHFDLLLADVQMPGFQPHGINVGNAALSRRDGPKVIYITGNPDQVPNGFVDPARTPVLAKPIRAEGLLASVEAALGSRG